MIELIKKTVLAGIGATVVTKEKIEGALSEFVKQGKVSAQEAQEFASKLAEDGKKEFEATSKELSEKIHALLAKADFARRSEMAALEKRVAELEAQLAELAKPAAK